MNKERGLLICTFFAVVLFTEIVAAAQSPTQIVTEVVKSTINSAVSVFGPVFEIGLGNYDTPDFLFAKVLLFLLLFLIINVVLKSFPKFGSNKGVCLIIAVVISLLSVRFISQNELTQGILLPYGTMGVAITTILPTLVFFYFLHVSNFGSAGRRLAWAFYAIIFLVLWSYKYAQIGEIMNTVYTITFLVFVVIFIFDRQIHYYFGMHELNVFVKGANQKTIAALQAEYLNIINVYYFIRRIIPIIITIYKIRF